LAKFSYFHGGVNFEPYREQFKKYFLEKILNITKYTMHEGFFAIQDLNNSSDLLLMLDYGSSMNLSQWILLAHQKVVRLADVSLLKITL
jgi:hypothetical protein